MKVAAIKYLVETYSIGQLQEAERNLCDEKLLSIEVEGADEGEKLTHILAALEILTSMSNGEDYKTALRNFSARVRDSIN